MNKMKILVLKNCYFLIHYNYKLQFVYNEYSHAVAQIRLKAFKYII